MLPTINKSEKYVYWICEKSFLSLWSYLNPIRRGGKEVCDILVVSGPHILIFSVKEIKIKPSGDESIDKERWIKRAIKKSCDQIYGAQRRIFSHEDVITRDGKRIIELPELPKRKIHRIAIAFGGNRNFPIIDKDFGSGFVHVFDEKSFAILLGELDTITDFIDYLKEKEKFLSSSGVIQLPGGEEDLLAAYLHVGRKFPEKSDLIILEEDLWENFKRKPEYIAKKKADGESYFWDSLIEIFCKDISEEKLEIGGAFSENEMVVRVMAMEDRFGRRILGKSFNEFLKLAEQNKVRSRTINSPSDVTYVFLAMPHGEDRGFRMAELHGRCLVMRSKKEKGDTVIGIATEQPKKGRGSSLDAIYMCIKEWNKDFQEMLDSMPEELNYFKSPKETRIQEDEFPGT